MRWRRNDSQQHGHCHQRGRLHRQQAPPRPARSDHRVCHGPQHLGDVVVPSGFKQIAKSGQVRASPEPNIPVVDWRSSTCLPVPCSKAATSSATALPSSGYQPSFHHTTRSAAFRRAPLRSAEQGQREHRSHFRASRVAACLQAGRRTRTCEPMQRPVPGAPQRRTEPGEYGGMTRRLRLPLALAAGAAADWACSDRRARARQMVLSRRGLGSAVRHGEPAHHRRLRAAR